MAGGNNKFQHTITQMESTECAIEPVVYGTTRKDGKMKQIQYSILSHFTVSAPIFLYNIQKDSDVIGVFLCIHVSVRFQDYHLNGRKNKPIRGIK